MTKMLLWQLTIRNWLKKFTCEKHKKIVGSQHKSNYRFLKSFGFLKPCLKECYRNQIILTNHSQKWERVYFRNTQGHFQTVCAFQLSVIVTSTHVQKYCLENQCRRNDHITVALSGGLSWLVHLIWFLRIFTSPWEWYFNIIFTCKKPEADTDK